MDTPPPPRILYMAVYCIAFMFGGDLVSSKGWGKYTVQLQIFKSQKFYEKVLLLWW